LNEIFKTTHDIIFNGTLPREFSFQPQCSDLLPADLLIIIYEGPL